MSSPNQKATIYVDIDDEITSLIDKMTQVKEKIVALVLPKRATMLQSIVNMKLLKRSADEAGKKIVLITSESNILPLAGAVGVHVAKTLQSKPAIPAAPKVLEENPEEDVEDVEIDKSAPVGALAGVTAADAADDTEEIEVPEDEEAPAAAVAKKPGKKPKKFKIPNFNKFRLKLILGASLLLLLIVGWILATRILPKADIVIKTDTSTFTKSFTATAATDVDETDAEELVVPAKIEEMVKQDSETVPATGQKNVGQKAEGTMTLTNCIDDGKKHTVPAGTSFSRNGKNFLTTEEVELGVASFSVGRCNSGGNVTETVGVVAAEGGSSYNIDEGSYTSSIAGINAYGSDMEGGTDQMVKVVSQQDVDKATEQLRQNTSEGTVEDLKALLEGQGYVPFESTYEATEPTTQVSVQPNTEAESVTVSSTSTFKMSGALRSGLEDIIRSQSEEDIDTSTQKILDTGIDSATIRVIDEQENRLSLSVETLVTAGPELNDDQLKQEILGKKRGETQSIIQSKAGVQDVEIAYSPFWVGSTPSDKEKVTITFEDVSQGATDSNEQ